MMDKDELKKILKPLIKECIKEVMFESGVLSKVVSEVAHGLGGNQAPLREAAAPQPREKIVNEGVSSQRQEVNEKLNKYKKEFAEKVSAENYGGVDLFEGTTPLSSGGSPGSKGSMGPMANIDPDDPGVDISRLMGQNGKVWKALNK